MGVIDAARRWLHGLGGADGDRSGPESEAGAYVCTACRRGLDRPHRECPDCGGIVVSRE